MSTPVTFFIGVFAAGGICWVLHRAHTRSAVVDGDIAHYVVEQEMAEAEAERFESRVSAEVAQRLHPSRFEESTERRALLEQFADDCAHGRGDEALDRLLTTVAFDDIVIDLRGDVATIDLTAAPKRSGR